MAPQKIIIDFEQLRKCCEVQCTLQECAAILGCSEDTVERRVNEEYGILFKEFFKKHSSGGRASLRRQQFAAAKDGSVPMMIWLGKQYLGQKEKQDIDIDVTDRKFNINFIDPDPKQDD